MSISARFRLTGTRARLSFRTLICCFLETTSAPAVISIISDQLQRLVIPNYFHGDKRPLLVSPDGAPLDSSIVDALTGHTQYAQAGGNVAAKVVGHVAKMTGSASIVRNGVTIDVQNGDAVYQSDVVQTGSRSTLGLVLDRRHHLQPHRQRAVDVERPDLRRKQHVELVVHHAWCRAPPASSPARSPRPAT